MRIGGTPKLLKRMAPKGLLARSLLIVVTPLVLVQVVSTIIFYDRHWDVVTRRLSHGVAGDLQTVIAYLGAHPGDEARRWMFRQARNNMQLALTLERGAILPNSPEVAGIGLFLDSFSQAMRQQIARPFIIDAESMERQIVIKVQLAEGVLTAVTPRKRLFSSTTYIFVLWMVGTSVIVLAVAVLFMRNQVRSVRRLAQAADTVGKGQDIDAFKIEGATEVRQAAQAFELMRERLKRQIHQRTEMLAGVSHDLRTPITRMKLQLAMLGDAEGIDELKEDVAEMERMVEGYLAFARGEGTETPSPTDMALLLESIGRRFRREGAAIDLHTERGAVVNVRPDALERCLSNLIANATRYGDHVAVRGGLRGGAYEITVDDDGPGIPAESREDAFKAFFRLDSSRNPTTGGTGLGLTIARDVIRAHGGDIRLEDSPLGGLRVRVTLPL